MARITRNMTHQAPRFVAAFVAAAIFMITSVSSAQETVAVKGGRIITMAGEPIENGVVVIVDGKITAVGADVSIPVEASVVDATGRVVMPGFVEAHTAAGLSQANESSNPSVPYLSVLDGIDPSRSYFKQARRDGVTSAAMVPGNSGMISGQAAVIKTSGLFVDDMVLKSNTAMKISLSPTGGRSRMGHLSALRHELDAAKDFAEENADADVSTLKEAVRQQLQLAIVKLVTGKMPAYIYCADAMDVAHAVQLTKDYEFKATLVLDQDCYKAAEQIAAANLPVILDSTLVFWETDPRTNESERIVTTEVFRAAGVPFTFQAGSSNNSTLGNNYLWYQAATAVKYGMPRDEALAALTIRPARMLGVDQFIGSLEVGKDGDLVILSGEPLKNDTWVETTIINGAVIYERSADVQLRRLLNGDAKDN
ncbi:MAG: amidohydrolase family protein [Pirellulales bacterium]|nr:amidohydrolase family protein [Pirellulales bacterium]